MNLKQKIVRVLFVVEVIAVVGLYIFGAQGILALSKLRAEVETHALHNNAIAADIQKLEDECVAWLNDPFYVEQCAREKLAMAREGELIYVVK